MSDIIDTTARGISTVTAEIKFLHKQANQFLISSAIEIGRRLVEAKSMLSHGEWGPWLEKEVEYSQSQANDLMRIYREYGTGQDSFFGNSQAIEKLPYTKALRLLTLPAEERAEFVEKNDVDAMSTRQLEQALKDLEEAKKREAEALAAADDAKAAAIDAQSVQRAVQGELDRAKAQTEMLRLRADEAENKAEKAKTEAAELAEKLKKARADLKDAQKAAQNPVISQDQMAKLRQEAEAQAAMEAEAKAKKAVENAEKKAKQAQQEAETARSALEKARAAQKTSDSNVAVFKVIFDQTQQDFNRLSGALKKVEVASPETAANLKTAIGAMLDKMGKELGV